LCCRFKRDIADDEPPFGNTASSSYPHAATTSDTSSSSSAIKGPWNANRRSRFVELVIVVDNRKYREHDSDLAKVGGGLLDRRQLTKMPSLIII
jgi:hypothetical protein